MKGLTENECGGQNALMKLASHLSSNSEHLRVQDRQFSRHMNGMAAPSTAADALVSEYLGIDQRVPAQPGPIQQQQPRTFQMEKLLSELKQIDSESQKLQVAALPGGNDGWAHEYFSLNPTSGSVANSGPGAFKWSTEYLTQSEATIFDEAWGNLINSSLSNVSSLNQLPSLLQSPDSGKLAAAENSASNSQLNDEMRKTANELLDSMQDSRFSETEVGTLFCSCPLTRLTFCEHFRLNSVRNHVLLFFFVC